MGDLEYSHHPTQLLEEEEEENNRETQELTVRVPTSRGSESPSATPMVRISFKCPTVSFVQLSNFATHIISLQHCFVVSLQCYTITDPDPVMVLLQHVSRLQGQEERI